MNGTICDILSSVLPPPEFNMLEFRAVRIGGFIMADAGHPPEAAFEFWKRAQDNPNFSKKV
jgi:hypothetical protein